MKSLAFLATLSLFATLALGNDYPYPADWEITTTVYNYRQFANSSNPRAYVKSDEHWTGANALLSFNVGKTDGQLAGRVVLWLRSTPTVDWNRRYGEECRTVTLSGNFTLLNLYPTMTVSKPFRMTISPARSSNYRSVWFPIWLLSEINMPVNGYWNPNRDYVKVVMKSHFECQP